MSTHISAVNQKLVFARQLLRMLEVSGSSISSSHQIAATAQSVAVQLHQAWLWHCRNIAEGYKLQDLESITDGDSLVAQLAKQDKCPGEAVELQTLQHDSNSWLSELLLAHKNIYLLPVVRKAEMDVDRLPMISLDGPKMVEWTVESAQLWLQSLEELIDRHREMMIEF
jgi:hypothetical protein